MRGDVGIGVVRGDVALGVAGTSRRGDVRAVDDADGIEVICGADAL